MLALFKGELSFEDITRKMIYKDMISLRDARVEQLTNERKDFEKEKKEAERAKIRNTLLATDPTLKRF